MQVEIDSSISSLRSTSTASSTSSRAVLAPEAASATLASGSVPIETTPPAVRSIAPTRSVVATTVGAGLRAPRLDNDTLAIHSMGVGSDG